MANPAPSAPPGDRQDVFRGTVFACGVNELGQLGTGRDLPWSGAPLRVVALKEAGAWWRIAMKSP
jgi:hypothetical protein